MGDDTTGSILTPSQRQFLRGERDDLSEASERMTKSRIYSRIEQAFRDIELIIQSASNGDLDLSQVSERAEDPVPTWGLAGLLFMFGEHKEVMTVDDIAPDWQPTEEVPSYRQQAKYVDGQTVEGVRRVMEMYSQNRVINDIKNNLEISMGPPLDDIENKDIAALPRRYIDQLLQNGRITDEEYGKIIRDRFERIESGDLDARPPMGKKALNDIDDLEQYLNAAIEDSAGQQNTDDGPSDGQ